MKPSAVRVFVRDLEPWGGTLATLRDPAGNEIQLVQPPST